MVGTSRRGPIDGMWERTLMPCGRTFPGVLLPVPTTACWVGGTGATGAVARLSQPHLPPTLLGLDAALEWPGGQHEEPCSAVVAISGAPWLAQDFCLLCSSLASDTVSFCHLPAGRCWWQGELEPGWRVLGTGDLGYLLIADHPTLPSLGAGGVSVLALSCGWRSCPSSGHRFCAFLA